MATTALAAASTPAWIATTTSAGTSTTRPRTLTATPPPRRTISSGARIEPVRVAQPRTNPELYDGIANFYDESSGVWEDIWGERMHHGFYDDDDSVGAPAVAPVDGGPDHRRAQIKMIEKSLAYAGVPESKELRPKTIVDVGCGIGGSSRYLARKYQAKVNSITLSPVQVERAVDITAKQGLSELVNFQVANALKQPFQDGSFDPGTLRPTHALGATVMMAESSCRTEDLKQSEGGIFMVGSEGIADAHEWVLTSAVDMIDIDEELLEEQDRITGALQIGVVGCRRSASWICFGGGARPRRKRAWKTVNRKGSFAKARKLVDVISELPSAKEEIYGALDAFVAWELEFPIIAIKKALQYLAQEQQWKRVIQVTKWMLSKGQGKTMGTYTLLLQALGYEGRVEEADALWEKILTQHEDATPRIMFTVVIAMFDHHNQPRRLLQVFADMKELEIKPDAPTVERVVKTYRGLGLLKRADAIEAKNPPTKWGYRYSKRGKKYRIRVTAEGCVIKPEDSLRSEAEAGVEEEDAEDSDSDYDDDYIYEEEPLGEESLDQESYLHNSESVLPSAGH